MKSELYMIFFSGLKTRCKLTKMIWRKPSKTPSDNVESRSYGSMWDHCYFSKILKNKRNFKSKPFFLLIAEIEDQPLIKYLFREKEGKRDDWRIIKKQSLIYRPLSHKRPIRGELPKYEIIIFYFNKYGIPFLWNYEIEPSSILSLERKNSL